MDSLFVSPLKKIKAEIHVPGDKSISHRAVMLGALAKGETVINGFLASADCLATVECFRKLGVEIERLKDGGPLAIKGKGLKGLKGTKEVLNVGNSGTTMRLMAGILAGQPFTTKITGDESIQKRPMMRVVKPLREMGASIDGRQENDNIYAPLKISGGNLAPIEYELPVASAQVKSAILLAGLFAKGETVVIEKNQARDHTERMLEYFGASLKVTGSGLRVTGGKDFDSKEIDVPGDISSAAFFMVAGLIVPNSELTIRNVGLNPTRMGIIEVLHRMGAEVEVRDETIISGEPRGDIVVRSSELRSTVVQGEIIPKIIDEIPIIAVAATQAQGVTEIRGARELRVKESDRIKTVCSELKKMGAKIEELEDGMIIEGPTKLIGAKIKSYGDHRIAMSMAIAGLIAEGETTIDDAACIETSFPGFAGIVKKISQ
ncbi:MAG: 3-phosphoshikimate 1-carboxyvinyltransferase [Candidatus Margulisbacteria bacterium]|nr:3-phosphoshikimate 1-carboxyvinyltransferase [Candidatus Margulisiibacteriota bacterium]